MNRRNRTLVVLLIAVVLASAASFLVYRTISRLPVRQVEVATMHVAVAAENLPTGTLLGKDHIKIIGWPSSSPVAGSFSTPEKIVGRGTIQPIAANEPLTENKLAPIEAGAGLPPSIPAGMRAMSVKVNEVVGVAGFTVPGTRVDVLVTLSSRDDSMARAVVNNVQVMTAGTRYDIEQAKDGKPIPSSVVTLMVTPEEAEKIALAQMAGRITLVLRNPLDTDRTETRGVRMPALMGPPAPAPVIKQTPAGPRRAAPPKPTIPVVPEPQPYQVESYKAGKRAVETIRPGDGGQREEGTQEVIR